MLNALQAPKGALVVLDRGIATEENLGWMQQAGYRYLVVNRSNIRSYHESDEAGNIQHIFTNVTNCPRIKALD